VWLWHLGNLRPLRYQQVWSVNEYQKTADMFFKILGGGWAALLFFDILKVLPNFISDRIVNMLLERIGL
jgi:hypothetical protein